ncbi:hypothetical protein D9615_005241 [Tricholomella constricta]|uniref:Uncharacterized protein n=1 Tax=Tricholomella constricta TaxID=117010 RepID=A0A8H5M1U7_9AGAR|nr:hypothetical protein D9615_005241 [Tricholomella constricta]
MNAQESTPLLGSVANARTIQPVLRLPPISLAVRSVAALEADQIRFENIVNYDAFNFEDHPTEVAYALVVLLYLRNRRRKSSPAHDLYERWLSMKVDAHDAQILEKQVANIWTLFLAEYRTAHNIATVLWSQFPLDDSETKSYRVVDFLADSDSLLSLTAHPLVISSLEHAWRYGVSVGPAPLSNSVWLTRYDALATPRVAHFIDWISRVAFLVLLYHYLLYPIERPHTSDDWWEYRYGAREIFLIILPLSFAARSWTLASISSLLVPLAFLASLSSAPHPASFTFTFIQWAAILQPIGLNLPQAPSHLFLLQHSHSLPLAFLVTRGLSKILYPAILFFLPLILLATYLLSLSLVDAFFRLFSGQFNPTPMETRFTFLCFLLIVIILFFSSILFLATTTFSSPVPPDPWEIYSPVAGHAARRACARATVSYIGPYTYPAPFNLLRILFICVPQGVTRRLKVHVPGLTVAERALWRIVVGPFTTFVALLFWRPRWLLPYSGV